MKLKGNFRDKDTPQPLQSVREKLSRNFKEWTTPRGEYGMILFENCVIHLVEDTATPSQGLVSNITASSADRSSSTQ